MQHHFILRFLLHPRRHHHHHLRHYHPSTTTIVSSINWVRDRALDHAVEKERNLKPMINLKNLINTEPSKSLPLSIITNHRSSLSIPTRPIDFIRKYPSVFEEFYPGGIGINPHVKLTMDTLTLDSEEQVLFDSDAHKQDVAIRLLKLLMLGRVNRIPLSVIDRLKWDLGLPNDYVDSIVPHFPDYFRVCSNSNGNGNGNGNGNELGLELVCWSDEMAVSVMQANAVSEFPIKYSRGFEVDKKFKKWVDEWQKVRYVSPYEDLMSLGAKSEEGDKWIVGLMHEVLHLLVPKKTEKDNLLVFGEYLGVRSRFKKALLEHPGIFYVSSKLHTHTVVLREGYKRDLLVSGARHPVMKLRASYIHLMNMVKEKSKVKDAEGGEKKRKETADLDGEDDELSDDVSEEEEEDDSEGEGVVDGDSEDLEETQRTLTKRTALEPVQRSRTRRSNDDGESEDLEEMEGRPTKRRTFEGRKSPVQRSRARRSNDNGESEDLENGNTKIRGRTDRTVKFNDSNRRNTPNSRGNDNDGRRGRGNDRRHAFDEKTDSRTNRTPDRRVARETNTPIFLRTERSSVTREGRSSDRSSASRTREGRPSDRSNVSRTSEGRSSDRSSFSRTREGHSSDRSSFSRTREGRSSDRSGVSRTREGRSSERSSLPRTREGRF